MNDVDKRFEEWWPTPAEHDPWRERTKDMLHQELRNQAEEIIDSLPDWNNFDKDGQIYNVQEQLRQKYLSD